jgi:RecA-family ATPase
MEKYPGSPRRVPEPANGPTTGFVLLEEAEQRETDEERASASLPGSELADRPPHPASPLDVFAASSLAGKPAPRRLFHVEGLIPARTVTLLGGDGATGKSLIALQLTAATALRSTWLGMAVAGGASLFVTAEDDKDEVHRRLEDVAAHLGVKLEDLDDLHIVSLAGEDALLALPSGRGNLAPTQRFAALSAAISDLQPALVVLDTLADLSGGDENSRTHARQFIGLLRGLALKHDTTVLLLAHPSLSGMSSGAGTSGSTAWSNSVRSRLYLERVKGEDGAETDPDVRALKTMKANYSQIGTELRMRWERGVFIATGTAGGGSSSLAAYTSREIADGVFLDMLAAYGVEGRHVSSTPSANFAPAIFARDPRSQGINKRGLADAMNRLFAAKRIEVVEFGPPSRRLKRIAQTQTKSDES